ncbi:MAG: hypothetical protein WAO83_22825 [Fuerstiella sp.]
MPKAIRTDSENNRTTGIAIPRLYYDKPATVEQQVHDGDTLSVRPDGDIGVRLLGIDTPEVSFAFPGPKLTFVDLFDAAWNDYLKTVFDSTKWGPFSSVVPDGLKSWIQAKLYGDPGTVHAAHAKAATDDLRSMITKDMEIMGQDITSFSYYLGFGFEVMDGYGRFLCTVNRNQPKRDVPTDRPPTYNLRMLERGRAFPYFIWPNISPWDRPDSMEKAVIPAGKAKEMADANLELKLARGHVRKAREQHLGIFDSMNPCPLEPFELRFLSRRSLPDRYVIDLSSDGNRLIKPENYYSVSHPEDRLWVSSIYVPFFEKHGWAIEA